MTMEGPVAILKRVVKENNDLNNDLKEEKVSHTDI